MKSMVNAKFSRLKLLMRILKFISVGPRILSLSEKCFSTKRTNLFALLPLIFCSLAFCSVGALATLGESTQTVEHDRGIFSGTPVKQNKKVFLRKMQTPTQFTIHEFEVSGTFIREYISDQGIVFGVSWSGLTHPDLTILLGTHFDKFETQKNLQTRERGVRYQNVDAGDLMVQKWGHIRDLHGRAYLKSLVPNGVLVNDIN